MSNATYEDRRAARKAADEDFRQRLEAAGFDGPHTIESGGFDPLGDMFGGRFRYAICLTCGAMVKVDDVPDGAVTERGLTLHANFHPKADQ